MTLLINRYRKHVHIATTINTDNGRSTDSSIKCSKYKKVWSPVTCAPTDIQREIVHKNAQSALSSFHAICAYDLQYWTRNNCAPSSASISTAIRLHLVN